MSQIFRKLGIVVGSVSVFLAGCGANPDQIAANKAPLLPAPVDAMPNDDFAKAYLADLKAASTDYTTIGYSAKLTSAKSLPDAEEALRDFENLSNEPGSVGYVIATDILRRDKNCGQSTGASSNCIDMTPDSDEDAKFSHMELGQLDAIDTPLAIATARYMVQYGYHPQARAAALITLHRAADDPFGGKAALAELARAPQAQVLAGNSR